MNIIKINSNLLFFQLIRYGVVGILQNSFGYLLYLFLTWIGMDPKVVIAVGYPIGVYISYLGNKNFTFKIGRENSKETKRLIVRYIKVHLSAYIINLSFILFFSDFLGYPHQIIQLFCIVFVALYLFSMFKLYVFREGQPREHA